MLYVVILKTFGEVDNPRGLPDTYPAQTTHIEAENYLAAKSLYPNHIVLNEVDYTETLSAFRQKHAHLFAQKHEEQRSNRLKSLLGIMLKVIYYIGKRLLGARPRQSTITGKVKHGPV